MDKNVSNRSIGQKALRLNLDENKYGTIAEIGAGQEVARQFFQAGAAAGTVAKTISAYDMDFSDSIYGTQDGKRYVSRPRVMAMLDKEFDLVIERVGTKRAKASRFFSYAATVAAKSFNQQNECHAWCGIKVQMYPAAEPSEIVAHVRMLDPNADQQYDVMGKFGVNLIYAAYYYFEDPKRLIDSLTDNLEPGRIEIDSIEFYGPYFEDVDNLGINLHLIRSWKTRAIMFNPEGRVVIPSEMLYKKNVLTIRGSFRPVTKLNVDMIEQGARSFGKLEDVNLDNSIALAEISLNDALGNDLMVPEEDIIVRVGLLNSLGYSVMVSDYTRYFSLRAYFRQFTDMQIGIVVGMVNIAQIFDETTYAGLEGGILEGFGKLFPDHTRLFVYPELDEQGEMRDFTQAKVPANLARLYQHLLDNNFIFGIESSDPKLFKIYSREVLKQMQSGRGDWEKALPEVIVEQIIDKKLLGFRG
ncbi:MAG: hypothetical protein KJP04_07440 [Arenicella sp.]|nr:hypothetical protein [Arenicella sp.]